MNEQQEAAPPYEHQYQAEDQNLSQERSLPPDLDSQEPSPCPVHGDPLRMWCVDCMEPACGLCVFDKHPMRSHNLVRGITFINGMKKKLLNNSDEMLRQTRQAILKNENAFQKCEVKLVELFEESKELHQLNNDLRVLISSVEFTTRVQPLLRAGKELRRIKAKTWIFPAFHQCSLEEDNDGGAFSMTQSSAGNLNSAMGALGLWVGQVGGGRARLTWDADKLLLCASSGSSPHPQPVLQLLAVDSLGSPEFPEVFLELSVGTQLLGIVYIKLWGHLRRAQNFMLLCMGTLGPSFVGSHLLPVTNRGTANESVRAGMYRDTTGNMTAMPLLTELEWGGQYQSPVSQGMLVASSGGKAEVDCLYSIITGDGENGNFTSCKFGWVSSGLEYLKEAILCGPMEEVWVSQCGLVLPRHTR